MIAHANPTAEAPTPPAPAGSGTQPKSVNLIGAGVSFDVLVVPDDTFAGEGLLKGDVLQLSSAEPTVGKMLVIETGPGADAWDIVRVVEVGGALVWVRCANPRTLRPANRARVRGVVAKMVRREV